MPDGCKYQMRIGIESPNGREEDKVNGDLVSFPIVVVVSGSLCMSGCWSLCSM